MHAAAVRHDKSHRVDLVKCLRRVPVWVEQGTASRAVTDSLFLSFLHPVSLATAANLLASLAARPIIRRTGLYGDFDRPFVSLSFLSAHVYVCYISSSLRDRSLSGCRCLSHRYGTHTHRFGDLVVARPYMCILDTRESIEPPKTLLVVHVHSQCKKTLQKRFLA